MKICQNLAGSTERRNGPFFLGFLYTKPHTYTIVKMTFLDFHYTLTPTQNEVTCNGIEFCNN